MRATPDETATPLDPALVRAGQSGSRRRPALPGAQPPAGGGRASEVTSEASVASTLPVAGRLGFVRLRIEL